MAVLSALQCKKGHKNIINHKLTYNTTVHIGKFIAYTTKKGKKTKTNMMKLNVICLFKKKRQNKLEFQRGACSIVGGQ